MPNPERPPLSKSDAEKPVTLTEQDLKDAARLFRLFSNPTLLGNLVPAHVAVEPVKSGADDRQQLLAKARLVLNSRRAREDHFHRDLFGEPAWEILLALYVTDDAGARLTVSKLADCIGIPLSTAVRWVKTLEENELVGRFDHPTDRRIVFVRLLPKGRHALDRYLSSLPG